MSTNILADLATQLHSHLASDVLGILPRSKSPRLHAGNPFCPGEGAVDVLGKLRRFAATSRGNQYQILLLLQSLYDVLEVGINWEPLIEATCFSF